MTRPDGREGSRAVLIGTARYTDPAVPPIPAAATNLEDLHRVLTAPTGGGFAPEHCTVLPDPDRIRQVGAAVGAAANAATDVLLVYYTGHGLLDRQGRLHLALTESDPDPAQVGWTSVPFSALRGDILESPARARVLILDCCFSGRAFEAMSSGADLITGQTEIRGTYTIVSSAANEISFAPIGARNTAFTAALLEAASEPGRSLDQLYRHADRLLLGGGRPRPRRRSTDIAGDLCLFGSAEDELRHRSAAENGDAGAMFEHALALLDRGASADAETWFRRAAEQGDIRGMHNLGVLLGQRGLLAEADIWYHRAAVAGHPGSMFNLGLRCQQQGALADAEAWYRRAAAADPHTSAMHNLAFLLEQRGAPAEAEVWFRRSAEAGDQDSMYNLALLLHRRCLNAEAETWLRRAAVAGNTLAKYSLALMLQTERGQWDQARHWYRQAAEEGYVDAMCQLAQGLHDRGSDAEAETWYWRAAQGGNTTAMYNLGVLMRLRGDVAGAQSWFDRAAAGTPRPV
ncbi:caspase, EACC1-associated type [Nocardia sp. NPDC003963]